MARRGGDSYVGGGRPRFDDRDRDRDRRIRSRSPPPPRKVFRDDREREEQLARERRREKFGDLGHSDDEDRRGSRGFREERRPERDYGFDRSYRRDDRFDRRPPPVRRDDRRDDPRGGYSPRNDDGRYSRDLDRRNDRYGDDRYDNDRRSRPPRSPPRRDDDRERGRFRSRSSSARSRSQSVVGGTVAKETVQTTDKDQKPAAKQEARAPQSPLEDGETPDEPEPSSIPDSRERTRTSGESSSRPSVTPPVHPSRLQRIAPVSTTSAELVSSAREALPPTTVSTSRPSPISSASASLPRVTPTSSSSIAPRGGPPSGQRPGQNISISILGKGGNKAANAPIPTGPRSMQQVSVKGAAQPSNARNAAQDTSAVSAARVNPLDGDRGASQQPGPSKPLEEARRAPISKLDSTLDTSIAPSDKVAESPSLTTSAGAHEADKDLRGVKTPPRPREGAAPLSMDVNAAEKERTSVALSASSVKPGDGQVSQDKEAERPAKTDAETETDEWGQSASSAAVKADNAAMEADKPDQSVKIGASAAARNDDDGWGPVATVTPGPSRYRDDASNYQQSSSGWPARDSYNSDRDYAFGRGRGRGGRGAFRGESWGGRGSYRGGGRGRGGFGPPSNFQQSRRFDGPYNDPPPVTQAGSANDDDWGIGEPASKSVEPSSAQEDDGWGLSADKMTQPRGGSGRTSPVVSTSQHSTSAHRPTYGSSSPGWNDAKPAITVTSGSTGSGSRSEQSAATSPVTTTTTAGGRTPNHWNSPTGTPMHPASGPPPSSANAQATPASQASVQGPPRPVQQPYIAGRRPNPLLIKPQGSGGPVAGQSAAPSHAPPPHFGQTGAPPAVSPQPPPVVAEKKALFVSAKALCPEQELKIAQLRLIRLAYPLAPLPPGSAAANNNKEGAAPPAQPPSIEAEYAALSRASRIAMRDLELIELELDVANKKRKVTEEGLRKLVREERGETIGETGGWGESETEIGD